MVSNRYNVALTKIVIFDAASFLAIPEQTVLRLLQKQGGVLLEKLPERGSIPGGRSYFGVLLQELRKCSQGHFVLPQGIAQMPQHRNDANQERRQGMRPCDITDCLLLHRELQIFVQLGKCFLGKCLHEVSFKLLSVQTGERRDIVQRVNDSLSCLLRFRKKLHIYICYLRIRT